MGVDAPQSERIAGARGLRSRPTHNRAGRHAGP